MKRKRLAQAIKKTTFIFRYLALKPKAYQQTPDTHKSKLLIFEGKFEMTGETEEVNKSKRDGAKYLCANCEQSFFTKIEAEQCFDNCEKNNT